MDPNSILGRIIEARHAKWRRLDLSKQHLKTLPGELGDLTSLVSLDLSQNDFAIFPECLVKLSSLQSLNLSRNSLGSISPAIDKLAQLRTLDLSFNSIRQLPDSLGRLKNLKVLVLSRNRLQALPPTLRDLPELELLYLHENPELRIHSEILGPTSDEVARFLPPARPRDILGYYFRVSSGSRPLNEAKVIFLGRGGVGKTSLVRRLTHKTFDARSSNTPGIQITDFRFHQKGDEIQVHIWDFGGQEIMHATHQFFLTERSLYLLVLSGREGKEDLDAEYWLRLIASFAPRSPILVVLNKHNEVHFDVNERGLSQKYPAICGFVRTDCATGMGIEDLLESIKKAVCGLQHLSFPFPANWFAIKNRLSTMKEPYLTGQQYREICTTLGVMLSEEQEQLAKYLHDLGIALNYWDDPRLQGVHVLNPLWVTTGIYCLLNSHEVARRNGDIRFSELRSILPSHEYPSEHLYFLLNLMARFELCFSYGDNDLSFLIPELLPKEEPVEVAMFDRQSCLNFQYSYPVLPEGLIPRFIVRSRVLSNSSPRWRSGVILQFGSCRALVQADVHDRLVTISVSGPEEARPTLLGLVRLDFERIHGQISQLDPLELIPLREHPEVAMELKELQLFLQLGKALWKKIGSEVLVNVDVGALLASVDLQEPGSLAVNRPARIFVSYAHRDHRLLDELEVQLKLLARLGYILPWSDRRIDAGSSVSESVLSELARADLVLSLLSPDYLASRYCFDIELKRAVELRLRIVPVILRECGWKHLQELRELKALPADGKPVTSWKDRNAAWNSVFEGLKSLIEMLFV